ncbi:hypothetical protein ACFCX0_46985 [Streptomyces sp. NPDC056352]|uniref:hypothetical protein n=1 Tax=Streptomyces sp. NPDC056352 TaxID=3345791 RepID=UPI0035D92959
MDEGDEIRSVDAVGAQGLQIGSGNVQFNVYASGPFAARSAYRHQVRLIAPEVLLEREEELAVLRDFCTRDAGAGYLWLRGQAWAGKTALMSWLVLNPPPGTRVVSFFITARLAAHNNREAFLDVVIEQLAALLGEPVPQNLTPATRPAHLWALLDDASVSCDRQGHRLVLVVDGLDEDIGAAAPGGAAGAVARSIAALLPARPPAGMRVVVAGRSEHSVPSDVPPGHPLRDTTIQYVLKASLHARVVQADAGQELERLLQGGAADRELLGLVAAAGGGLSSRDLAELTGRAATEIEESLRASAGRSITRRLTHGGSDTATAYEIYVLGHEEIQQETLRRLGAERLREYRQRLHTWANGYRRQNWPAGTPGYLLRGWFQLLGGDGNTAGMVELALDKARHDRLLEVSGADNAALTEIAAAQDAILDQEQPDLHAMTLLALRRDQLAQRNLDIPTSLPAVWALLGRPLRAEALARSIPRAYDRARALASLSEALRERGTGTAALGHGEGDTRPDTEGFLSADETAEEAEAVARSLTDPNWRSRALADVAAAYARAGNNSRADALANEAATAARAENSPYVQASSLTEVAETMTGADRTDLAEDIIRDAVAVAKNEADDDLRELVLAEAAVALALARGESTYDAEVHAAGIRAEVQAINETEQLDIEASGIAKAEARAGDTARAFTMAQDIIEPWQRSAALAAVVGAAVRAGEFERPLQAAQAIPIMQYRTRAVADAAAALARAGQPGRARSLAHECEVLARQTARLSPQKAALAKALAGYGEAPRALAVADSIAEQGDRSRALTEVAIAAARSGDTACAGAAARTITDAWDQAKAHVALVGALTRVGETDRAEGVARTIMHRATGDRVAALSAVAGERARQGEAERAADIAREAVALARTIDFAPLLLKALAKAAEAVAAAGDARLADELVEEAEDAARKDTTPYSRSLDLAALSEALVPTGRTEYSRQLARDAVTVARTLFDQGKRGRALADAAKAMAKAGDTDLARDMAHEATAVTRTVAEPNERAASLAERAEVLARVGETEHALSTVRALTEPGRQAQALAAVALHVEPARAQRLIAQALRLDDWQTSAEALSTVQPEVLLAVAEELLAIEA